MIELKGAYCKDCKIFIDDVESEAISTIYSILNDQVSENVPVRIMPDTHNGQDIVVGFTMPLTDRVNPYHIGVDGGCGVLSIPIPKLNQPLEKIDRRIREVIPMGFEHRKVSLKYENEDVEKICKKIHLNYAEVVKQMGTLGGGNHFIEIGETKKGWMLFIHSGSRNFGLQVCKFHGNQAKAGKHSKYLFEDKMKNYLADLKVVQEFAAENRKKIAEEILKVFNLPTKLLKESFDTVHNYIGTDQIIRKGAISAHQNEMVVIPLNMRDGVLWCRGLGNVEWNNSAPHGAGRILSRNAAKAKINLVDFKNSMKGIYSSSVCKETIDESPMAYKDAEIIKGLIGETVEILEVIKPVLNLKAH